MQTSDTSSAPRLDDSPFFDISHPITEFDPEMKCKRAFWDEPHEPHPWAALLAHGKILAPYRCPGATLKTYQAWPGFDEERWRMRTSFLVQVIYQPIVPQPYKITVIT